MKARSHLLAAALTGCLAAGNLVAVSSAVAQTTTATTTRDRTTTGNYRSTDGTAGTYIETFSLAGKVSTDKIVYTPTGSTETITDLMVVTVNADGTKTSVTTQFALGATTPSTFTVAVSAQVHGAAAGTGTFTLADGTAGTLTALVYKAGPANLTSLDLASAAGLTRVLRSEERGNGGDSDTLVTVTPAGTLTSVTLIRFGGMHHHHL